ncbi:MAG: Gfo/Idh/MocA family oxidoreductase [Gemmataceae bacterium]|nr:Gfo/Idh/MocA family oxidoreductase [Gemmataceae bacterium]
MALPSRQSRRQFMQKTLAAVATVTIAGTKSSGRVVGANDAIRVGVAGINGRGGAHVSAFLGIQNVQITYLIDVDTRTFRNRLQQIQAGNGGVPQTVQDVRRALDDRNLDVISIATPNHWHSLMTIWAAQAGKHVYVEKPLSHNVHEGRIAVEIARRHNVIVQHGTQSRSEARWAHATALARSGQLGRLKVARALCYKPRNNSMGRVPSVRRVPVPADLNFNIWCGPAPLREYHENLVPYRWHWYWDFGNGDLGNQGVHQMDIARWGIPNGTLPRSVISLGGRYDTVEDHGETANTQIAAFDFGATQLIFEVRGLLTNLPANRRVESYRGQMVGNIFHCEEGDIVGNSQFFPRGSTTAQPLPRLNSDLPERPVADGRGETHFRNFIAAVRSRRRADLNADVLEGHFSSALCHLANISYRLGENVPFNPRTRAFAGNADATDALERMEAHLSAAAPAGNGLQLNNLQLRVGPRLTIDARAETITGNDAASRMLFRQYRAPFVVPERVG